MQRQRTPGEHSIGVVFVEATPFYFGFKEKPKGKPKPFKKDTGPINITEHLTGHKADPIKSFQFPQESFQPVSVRQFATAEHSKDRSPVSLVSALKVAQWERHV